MNEFIAWKRLLYYHSVDVIIIWQLITGRLIMLLNLQMITLSLLYSTTKIKIPQKLMFENPILSFPPTNNNEYFTRQRQNSLQYSIIDTNKVQIPNPGGPISHQNAYMHSLGTKNRMSRTRVHLHTCMSQIWGEGVERGLQL